ncbi:MAG: hypothetical protein VX255_02995, partial [Candidatus Latescibacterota bacterium]|nr:hypothetical protein [Candidatus Latescibacterota bacterium]
MGYVDAHVHVWTDNFDQFPFACGVDPANAKPTTFHAEDILGHAHACGVDKVVLVQMRHSGEEPRSVLAVRGDPAGGGGGGGGGAGGRR